MLVMMLAPLARTLASRWLREKGQEASRTSKGKGVQMMESESRCKCTAEAELCEDVGNRTDDSETGLHSGQPGSWQSPR